MFELDWKRASHSEKFTKCLARAMKLKATGKLLPEVKEACLPIVPRLGEVINAHYDWLQLSYEFYRYDERTPWCERRWVIHV